MIKDIKSDIQSVIIWLISRLSILLMTFYFIWTFSDYEVNQIEFKNQIYKFWNLQIWNNWDVGNYLSIANKGYFLNEVGTNIAFFPGFPLLIKFLSFGIFSFLLIAMIIVFTSGFISSIFLNRLSKINGDKSFLTLILWLTTPMSIYLFVPYSEPLYCALSFASWYYAKNNKWLICSILLFCSSAIRINGLFLTLSILVMWTLSEKKKFRDIIFLFLGFFPLAVYFTYLKIKFGDWLIWFKVQNKFWQREFTNPLSSFKNSISRITETNYDSSWLIQNVFELIAGLLIIIFAIYFLKKKLWPEFTLVFLTLLPLITSTFWWSIPRNMLTLIPIWLILGSYLSNHKFIRNIYFLFIFPIFVINVVSFASGNPIS